MPVHCWKGWIFLLQSAFLRRTVRSGIGAKHKARYLTWLITAFFLHTFCQYVFVSLFYVNGAFLDSQAYLTAYSWSTANRASHITIPFFPHSNNSLTSHIAYQCPFFTRYNVVVFFNLHCFYTSHVLSTICFYTSHVLSTILCFLLPFFHIALCFLFCIYHNVLADFCYILLWSLLITIFSLECFHTLQHFKKLQFYFIYSFMFFFVLRYFSRFF